MLDQYHFLMVSCRRQYKLVFLIVATPICNCFLISKYLFQYNFNKAIPLLCDSLVFTVQITKKSKFNIRWVQYLAKLVNISQHEDKHRSHERVLKYGKKTETEISRKSR